MTSGRAVVMVAHPDDEVIYFGNRIRRLVAAGVEVDIFCATGQFVPDRLTPIRRGELARAAWLLGARARFLRLVDTPEPLDQALLEHELARVRWGDYESVYTHGVCGEYGHPHHIQVCRSVHSNASALDHHNVFSLSGPLSPVVCHTLDAEEVVAKRWVAREAYPSQPFAVDLCTGQECFSQLGAELADRLTATALHPYADHTAAASVPTYPEIANVPTRMWSPGHRYRICAVLAQVATLGQNGAGSPVTDLTK